MFSRIQQHIHEKFVYQKSHHQNSSFLNDNSIFHRWYSNKCLIELFDIFIIFFFLLPDLDDPKVMLVNTILRVPHGIVEQLQI